MGSLTKFGYRRVSLGSSGGSTTLSELFANGEQGAWYDPSDFSTLFQDHAGTTQVTAVEQPVGRMLDKSGRGNHQIQSTASARPLLKQDGSGKYYLKPDGVDDWMVSIASVPLSASDKLLVSVGTRKLTDPGGYQTILESSDVANDSFPGSFQLAGPVGATGNYYCAMVGTTQKTASFDTASYAAPITNIVTMVMDIGAAATFDELAWRVNAVSAPHSGGEAAGTGNFGDYSLYLFCRGGYALFSDFHFYGAVIRGGVSSGAQITLAEEYLAGKSGVTL